MSRPLDPGGLIKALAEGNVNFIVIGGFAVGAHGLPRATKDLDIVPDPAPDNLQRLARVLEALEAEVMGSDEFDPEELPATEPSELLKLGGNIVLVTKLGRLDIFQLVEPGWSTRTSSRLRLLTRYSASLFDFADTGILCG